MKNNFTFIFIFLFTVFSLQAQTNETFESATDNANSFTSNGKTFNLTSNLSNFYVANLPGLGYNTSNRFLQADDSYGQIGIITAATGTFKINSLWIYLTGNAIQDPNVTSNGATGTVTFRGKLAGVTQFTVTKSNASGNIGFSLPGNGFVNVNFATESGSNNTTFNIDQLEIELSSNYDYFAIDNFNWTASTTPTINTPGVLSPFSTCSGTPSTIQNFTVSGSGLSANIAVNAPAGYEVSLSSGSGFGSSVTVNQSGGNASATVYARLSSTATGTPSGNIVLSSTGGTNVNVAVSGTVTVLPSITTNPPNRTICNGANTTFSISATGATAYQWQVNTGSGFTDITNGGVYSNATTSILTITGAISGMNGFLYRCVAKDGSCSTNSNSGTLTVSSISTASGAQSNVSCFGGSNGAAAVTPSGGISPYTYSWSPSGGTGSIATGLSAGTYTVTVTDNIGCTAARSYTITQPAALEANAVSQTNVACNGGATGAASVSVSGGTSGYSYDWTPGNPTGDGTNSVTGLTAGTWTCTVTDANACTTSVNFIITQPPALSLTAASQTNIACNGGTNGAAAVNTATGGAGGYTYNWTPGNPVGDGTTSVSGLTAGTWTCTVTDANSCTASVNFTVTQPTALSLTAASQTNVACNGGSNGAAAVNTPTGGAGGYTYNWTPGNPTGDGTNSVTGLTAGTWTCTVTDANACTASVNFTVTQPSAISLTAASQTNIACNGGATGAATVNAAIGGAGGYTYNWTPGTPVGDGTVSVTGLTAGTWTCTVTDANACTTAVNFTITQPPALSLSAASQTNVSCNGGSNGAATVNTPTGGAGGYTYNWTPGNPTGDGTNSVTGLTAGTWTCTVTDSNACTTAVNFTITQPPALSLTAASQTNVACNGGSNGAASVNTSTGGAGGYTYNWTPGNPTGDGTTSVTGLTAGTWTCTVTDANACTTSVNFTITQPPALSLSAASQTNVSCNGGSNGAAAVNTPTGGAGGYTYNWTPGNPTGDGTNSVTGLTAGTWTCTVTDANACTTSVNFIITQPPALSLTAASQTNIACNGGANGAAAVNVATGGAGGYSYNWTPGNPLGDGTTSVSGLTAGTWTCTVTDANGCTASQNFTVTQPSALALTASSQTNIACNAGSNGAAAVNVATGGAGGYTYNWTPGNPLGDGTTSVSGLTAGTWTCTVTDANGCTASQNFTVTQPSALALTASSQTNIACNGGATGAATVNAATGGAGGYTYNWTPGNPTGDGTTSVTGLTAGTWTCTVTDANACTASQTFTVTQPSALNATAASQTNVSCNGGANGSATVSVSGGTLGYTYSWSPSGGTNATATGLAAGTYIVTVTDANACQATQSFTITQPTALVATAVSQTNVSCNGGTNGSATVSVSGGTPGYTYSWSPSGGTAATATGLAAGTYTVTVTDANACQTTQSFTITQPTALVATAASQTNVSCNGGTNGSATVSVSGGTSGYTYSWSPSGGTAATATGLAAGTYTVTVTDANACQTTQSFTITQPTALVATAASQTNVSCNGGTNGSATVSVSGGTSGYTYSWSPSGGTAATATGLSAGTYTVTVTDANSCQTTQMFAITEPTAIGFTTTTLPGYDYNTSYSQTIAASGGTGSKTYVVTTGDLPSGFNLASNGVLTGTSTQVADSNFTVTVTDANACTATYNYTLKLNQIPVTVTADASQTKVYGASDPIFTYTVTPALLPGDSFTGALTRVPGENIGSYEITQGTLSAGDKYLITYVSKDFVITTKPITVTADVSQTKVYGTVDPAFTYSVSPSLVSGDSFTGALTRTAGENIGAYAINQGSLSAGSNYDITYVSKDFIITAKPITITADVSQTKVYGTVDPTFTYSVSPSLVSGDSFTGALTRVSGENVGTYVINQGSLSAGSNYDITYVSKDFTITAKSITVTADVSQTKVYGTVDPTFTYTVSPSLVSGDSFTGTLSRISGEDVGIYAITQGSLSAGSNYDITYNSKDFTITAKPIIVTADASQTKVYGTVDPTFTYTVSPSLVSGDSFTGALSRVSGENVGLYAITQGTLTAGGNYTISFVSKDFSITKANQTISWNQVFDLGCETGSTAVLTADASSSLPVNYTSSNTNIATISDGVLSVHDYGFTTITASQEGNNNYFPASSVTLTVVNRQPNLIRKQFDNVIFFDNSSKQFMSYTWYKDGALDSGQTLQYYKENGMLNGIYYAKATRLDGMVVTTCPLVLSSTVEDEYIKIAPNPVKPNVSYELLTNVSSARLQNAHVEVYSVGGILMQDKMTNENVVTLTAPLVEGIYVVKMTLSNGKIFTKNLLVRN